MFGKPRNIFDFKPPEECNDLLGLDVLLQNYAFSIWNLPKLAIIYLFHLLLALYLRHISCAQHSRLQSAHVILSGKWSCMSSLWPHLNVALFHFSIGRVTCLLSWTLYIWLVLTCYHIWLSALPPKHQLSLITDTWWQTHWAHNCTTFSQHLNKHIEKRKVTDHCRLVNHIFPFLYFLFRYSWSFTLCASRKSRSSKYY